MSEEQETSVLKLKNVELDQRSSSIVYRAVKDAIDSHHFGLVDMIGRSQKVNPEYKVGGNLYDPNIFYYDISFDSQVTREVFEALVTIVGTIVENEPLSYKKRELASKKASELAKLLSTS